MNCKPEDLAVVVRTSPDDRMKFIGRIVTVHRVEVMKGNHVFWSYSPCFVMPDGRVIPHIEDAALRPIRDPGDDAQDEMLRPLPADKALDAALAMGDNTWGDTGAVW